ncbi:unnamed protein product [Nesidiocoris tenuis]|uniref:Uncharacterized protein n=1 Tax=Nesidiocoris tenuis TaxID=355587 RepID=A0A6H5FVQ1_9HEMI|nr:unnamed protein product [Nesidiocoris tenuis]
MQMGHRPRWSISSRTTTANQILSDFRLGSDELELVSQPNRHDSLRTEPTDQSATCSYAGKERGHLPTLKSTSRRQNKKYFGQTSSIPKTIGDKMVDVGASNLARSSCFKRKGSCGLLMVGSRQVFRMHLEGPEMIFGLAERTRATTIVKEQAGATTSGAHNERICVSCSHGLSGIRDRECLAFPSIMIAACTSAHTFNYSTLLLLVQQKEKHLKETESGKVSLERQKYENDFVRLPSRYTKFDLETLTPDSSFNPPNIVSGHDAATATAEISSAQPIVKLENLACLKARILQEVELPISGVRKAMGTRFGNANKI